MYVDVQISWTDEKIPCPLGHNIYRAYLRGKDQTKSTSKQNKLSATTRVIVPGCYGQCKVSKVTKSNTLTNLINYRRNVLVRLLTGI
jgi:hypothetical protein